MHSVPPARAGKAYVLVSSWNSIYPSSVSFELSTWIQFLTCLLQVKSFCHSQNCIHMKIKKKKRRTAPNIILGAGQLIRHLYGQGTENMESKFQVIAPRPAGQEVHEYTHLICYSLSSKSLVIVWYNFLFPLQIWEASQLRKKTQKWNHKPTFILNSAWCYKSVNSSAFPGKKWHS